MSRIIRKRYRWLWLLFIAIFIGCLFVWNKGIISYDFSNFNSDLASDDLMIDNKPQRGWHPRMELFEEGVESLWKLGWWVFEEDIDITWGNMNWE